MRLVSAALQEHLEKVDTTTTRLLKITLRDGTSFGLCMLDRDIVYDDGAGPLTYKAMTGFDPSTISSDANYSVDNAEGTALLSGEAEDGLTAEMVHAGALDDAQWVCYLINYEDPEDSSGGTGMILDAGDIGEVTVRHGLVFIPELLSFAMRLRQPVGGVWSRSCRAIFGSPPNSQTGCGVDVTSLWESGTVLSVGDEPNRTFTGDNEGSSASFVPGRLEWLTGANLGRLYSIEESGEDGTISLNETTPYAIEVGDTYRARPDCRKRYVEDCIGVWNNGPRFKGEPFIPVGDSGKIQAPGAELPGGTLWHANAE